MRHTEITAVVMAVAANVQSGLFNRLTVSDFLMQFITMLWVMEDSSNNDLMHELQKQNKEYLEKIISNQNEIMSILSRLDDMSAK